MMYGEVNKKVTSDMYKRAEKTNILFKDMVNNGVNN
jgi:hypothetical protein